MTSNQRPRKTHRNLTTKLLCILAAVTLCNDVTHAHDVTPSCPPDVKTCVFTFTVSNVMSMMVTNELGRKEPIVVFENGTAYSRATQDPCGTLVQLSRQGIVIRF